MCSNSLSMGMRSLQDVLGHCTSLKMQSGSWRIIASASKRASQPWGTFLHLNCMDFMLSKASVIWQKSFEMGWLQMHLDSLFTSLQSWHIWCSLVHLYQRGWPRMGVLWHLAQINRPLIVSKISSPTLFLENDAIFFLTRHCLKVN